MYAKLLFTLALFGINASVFAGNSSNTYTPPNGVTLVSDISYGADEAQAFDVYMPTKKTKDAPVIFMIHGGAWEGGDKTRLGEFENKVAHWVTKGFVFISTNYRTLPKLRPVEQTEDIETAIRFAQRYVSDWGGASDKFILMGHSSGAHLVSLVSANYDKLLSRGIKPWIGTVSLDISGYDIIKKVTAPEPSQFYKDKFGDSVEYIVKASPYHVVSSKIPAFLAVCSTRSVDACSQAKRFAKKIESFKGLAKVLPVDLSHGEINSELGKKNEYTSVVDKFLSKIIR